MSWISKHEKIWQVAALLLLLTAIIGPWFFFERYSIPSSYTCPDPNVRVSETMCGKPISGIQVIWLMISGSVVFIAGMMKGTLDLTVQWRDLLILPVFLLGIISIVLPVFTFLRTIVKRNAQKRGVFHILALGLALVASLVWLGLLNINFWQYWYLWGSWLYTSMIICALILELLTRAEVGRNTPVG